MRSNTGIRIILVILCLVFIAAFIPACESKPVITEPAPQMTPVPSKANEPPTPLITLAEEKFEDGIEGWVGFADPGALSEVTWSPEKKLEWSVDIKERQAAVIVRHWPDLSDADGITIKMTSGKRSAFLVLGIQEADGSNYSMVLPVAIGTASEYPAPFEGFSLQADSEDENGQLDKSQLEKLSIIDISAHIAAPGPNRILIESITLWTGRPDTADFFCTGNGQSGTSREFRIGVDANFIPQGEQHHGGFRAGEKQVDALELFAVNGVDSLRLRLWVGKEGDSKLDYATELGLRAQEAGIQPYLVLFLHDTWNDVNKQYVPAVWADLTFEERTGAIREYCYETAQHFLEQGIDLDFYEIGNEIDNGICGVFADTTHPRDAESLRRDIWPDEAHLIRAAIEGVREADPGARFMLHIANSWDPQLASAFYQAMTDFGVEYDYCGLSFYPTAFGVITASRICETLDMIRADIGKPVIIAETAYPAEPPSGELFGDWRRPIPGYPLTPEGQACWLRDLFDWMRNRDDVLGVYVFSPDFWFSGEIWSAFALFDSEGRARPAVASFNTGG